MASSSYGRRLRHSVAYCHLQNFVTVKPSGGDDTAAIQEALDRASAIKEGDERHCRCGRTWRVSEGVWKLVLHHA